MALWWVEPMTVRILLLLIVLGAASARGAELSFNRDVRPILSDNCYYCHGFDEKNRKAKLRLDTFEGATADRKGSRAVVPGDLAKSDLWARIISTDEDEVMPPPKAHKTLSPAQKDILKRWIEQGAKYESHWAFVAPVRPEAPRNTNAIDHFIGLKLRKERLGFAPQADKGALLRRVSFDLTGLPPTAAELDAFLRDRSPDAYEKAVDRLLASPAYGEHQAMAWLDAARYADSNGYQMDALRMNWPWRDWVVRAFNTNMPFDRFTIEQLAGDLLPNPTQDQLIATAFNRNHMLNAEGGTIPEENRTKNVFDRVETTGAVWLGLTMNCTQCHDHKFDPVTQRDYYAMYALFNQIGEPGGVDRRFGKKDYSDDYDKLYMMESPYLMLSDEKQKAELARIAAAKTKANAELAKHKEEFSQPFIAWVKMLRADPDKIAVEIKEEGLHRIVNSITLTNLDNGQTKRLVTYFLKTRDPWKRLQDDIDRLAREEDAVLISIPHVMIMRDDKPRKTRILERGNYETPGAEVEAGTPAFLPPLPSGMKTNRLALARWLVAPEQPLMARVVVNRFWQGLFGHGFVKTPEDFGVQSPLPTHPELLDWLAVEFRESAWDVKRLLRLMVTSRTYRQSAAATSELVARDPENLLYARGPRFRLDSRTIRDQALAISGLLVSKQGGPPVSPYQPAGIVEEMSFGKNRYFQGQGEELYRRSLYTFWRRVVAPANFFDVPARQFCSVKPLRTSTPLHALTTLNDPTYVEAARVWAAHLMREKGDTTRLRQGFRSATQREPEKRELALLQRSLAKAREHFAAKPDAARQLVRTGESPLNATAAPAEHAAWTTVCLMLLNLDETLTK